MEEVLEQEEQVLQEWRENTETEPPAMLIAKDLAAGTLAGFVLTGVGFPFDTIKTRMQIYHSSLTQTIGKILREGKVHI